ncbi:Sterile alpha motif/pointed domain-containing protein [Strongyloides ratti]|uniref:Sterile alpha motif/pointed domain-containing protein n=1 Tax=Strongyloides ratti TaxID=34506 RepID=A0A090MZ70_STRRB|nr:Sterile alpha motif/pointed domain-containing protein [Strongyloides ratti]CEF68419.1 Sterile alpha motif/pointed domain-containing protein [Strongyloides ratti]
MFHKIWIKDGFLLKPHPIGLPWREEKELGVDMEINEINRRSINNSKKKPSFLSLAQKNCFEYGYLNNILKNYHDSRKTSNNSIISIDFDKKRDDIFMRSKDNYNNSLLKSVCKKSVDDNRGSFNNRYSNSKEIFSKSNNNLFENKNNIHSLSIQPTQLNTNNSSYEDSYNYKRFPSIGKLSSSSSIVINQPTQLSSSSNTLLHQQMILNDNNSSKTNVNISQTDRKNSKRNIQSNFNSSIKLDSFTGINSENIKQIFLENDLEKYIEKIEQHEIDMEIFLTLNRQDLINVFEIKTKTEDNIHLTTMLNLIKYYKNLYNIT